MNWWHLISYFFGGAFLANAIPHVITWHDGTPVPKPFCQAAGSGVFLLNRQRGVGRYQSRCRLRPDLPRWRLYGGLNRGCGKSGIGFSFIGRAARPPLRPASTAATFPASRYTKICAFKIKHGPAGDGDPLAVLRAAEPPPRRDNCRASSVSLPRRCAQ